MANKQKFQAIKGTRDLLPPETELWNRVEQTAREVFGTFGFGEIRPPIFEPTELFARAIGAETDVVAKEMYTFEDHDLPDLAYARSDLKMRNPSVDNLPGIEAYRDRLGDLYAALERAFHAGAVPRTPENRHAITRLGDLSVALGDPSLRSELQGLSHDVRSALEQVRLGDVVTLRPEATASVCRAYIEHNMHALTQPVKLYYTGPMFRRERPQKGRYRQFYQIGAEVLEALQQGQGGAKDIPKDAAIDAEVIEMVMVYFARLGLEGVQLDINSIGHSAPDCRRGYVEKLKAALEKVKDKLGADSLRRIETNPLRVLDSKLESEQEIIAGLPRIGEHLCTDCANHYAELKRQLELRRVAYRENFDMQY